MAGIARWTSTTCDHEEVTSLHVPALGWGQQATDVVMCVRCLATWPPVDGKDG